MTLLSLESVESYYGRIQVLFGISMFVEKGDIITIVGSNGGGKSTLLNVIAGIKQCDYGTIKFEDKRIDNLDPNRIVEIGISLVPEGRRIFGDLTVLENLKMGAFTRRDASEKKSSLEWVYDLFPRLKARESFLGKHISGGEQQMLAIGRALMSKPRLLMLDEPSLGLSPLLVKELFRIIAAINQELTTVLLVEQNVRNALKVANYAYVLLLGNVDKKGTPEEFFADQDIRDSYMGEGRYVDRKQIWRGMASTRK